jgi:hypothetical protein
MAFRTGKISTTNIIAPGAKCLHRRDMCNVPASAITTDRLDS